MNQPETDGEQDGPDSRPVFISYATADRKEALSVCKAIERCGTKCWIASRDVAPGENYQEEIVQSIRDARALVLVFSQAANHSDEIKKELSLASRYRIPVITLRIGDVEPSDAFAYELSTRQWIDAFDGWDQAIKVLIGRIEQLSPSGPEAPPIVRAIRRDAGWPLRRLLPVGLASLAGLAAVGAWLALRSPPVAPHTMQVRLTTFQLLSPDLPSTLPASVGAEIIAAFNADGVVGVSTASAPAAGDAPAYSLGGTLQRDGKAVRVITRLTNERSGTTLWSDNFNYDENPLSKIPRHVAVDAGNVVRCGLFGASTYRKALPDSVLRDYMLFCQGHWDPNLTDGRKALVPAERVVAAAPDFSWGWAAVAGAYWKVSFTADRRVAEEARAKGRQAADRALAIDSRNSEALWIKSLLIDEHDWVGREKLLKGAVASRSLDCGCEHHQYGEMLVSVGRTSAAVEQLHQANDMLALYVYTRWSLAKALIVDGKNDDAKPVFDAAIGLAPNAEFAQFIIADRAAATGDVQALLNPELPLPAQQRAALITGYRAMASQNADMKTNAAKLLVGLPEEQQNNSVAILLGALGADRAAFQVARRRALGQNGDPSLFWNPSMRGTLSDPGFPAVAKQLGLINYWRRSRTRPDSCTGETTPPFCKLI